MREVSAAAGDVVYYLHADHLGSTSLVTDGEGNVHSRQLFLPYGDTRWQEGALPTDFGFGGQRHDGSTGLVFMHARYYHPALGRFISADTIVPNPGNPQSLNRYSYVLGNPLKYTDPTGHRFRPPQRLRLTLNISDWNPQVVQALTVAQETAHRIAGSPIKPLWLDATARAYLKYVSVESAEGTMVIGNREPWSATEVALQIAGLTAVIEAPTASVIGDAADNVTPRLPGGTGADYDKLTGQGLYVLRDSDEVVRYIGRGDAPARAARHALDPNKGPLEAQIVAYNNLSKSEAKGLEQLVMDHFGGPLSQNPNTQLLNRINGVSPANPNYATYVEAGQKLFEEVLKIITGE